MRQVAPYLNLGFQLAVSVCLLGGLGWYLDGRWNTSPLWLLVGLGLGAVVGFIQFLRSVRRLLTKDRDDQSR